METWKHWKFIVANIRNGLTAKTSTSALPLPFGPPATAVGAPPELASTCPAMLRKDKLTERVFQTKKLKLCEKKSTKNNVAFHQSPKARPLVALANTPVNMSEYLQYFGSMPRTFTDLFTKLMAHLQMLTFDGITITACLTQPWWSSSIGSNKLKGLLPTIDLTWRTLQAKRKLDCACVLTGCLVSRLHSQGWDVWF